MSTSRQNRQEKSEKINEPHRIHVKGGYYEEEKKLGAGTFGFVSLYCFNQFNEKQKQYEKTNQRKAIKFCKNVGDLEKELKIAEETRQQMKDQSQLKNYILLETLTDVSDKKYGMMDFIVVDEKRDVSCSLDKFVTDLQPLLNKGHGNDVYSKMAEYLQTNPGMMLSQLTSRIGVALDDLHQAGYLHLDFACRNLMISPPEVDKNGNVLNVDLKVIDFGMSAKANNVPRSDIGPIRWMDSDALFGNKSTVTDVNATKTSIIEMLGLLSGTKNYNSFLCFQENRNTSTDYCLSRVMTTNQKALEKFLNNVNELLEKNAVFTANQKNEIKIYISSYRDFITQEPTADIQANRDLLLMCNENFLRKYLHLKLSTMDIEKQFDEIQLLRERMLRTPVSETFKNEENGIYQQLKNMTNKDSVRVLSESLSKEEKGWVKDVENRKNTQPPSVGEKIKESPYAGVLQIQFNASKKEENPSPYASTIVIAVPESRGEIISQPPDSFARARQNVPVPEETREVPKTNEKETPRRPSNKGL